MTQGLRVQPSSAREILSLVEKVRSHTPRVTKRPSYWAHNYWDKSKWCNEDLKKERERNLESYFSKLRTQTLNHYLTTLAPSLSLTLSQMYLLCLWFSQCLCVPDNIGVQMIRTIYCAQINRLNPHLLFSSEKVFHFSPLMAFNICASNHQARIKCPWVGAEGRDRSHGAQTPSYTSPES